MNGSERRLLPTGLLRKSHCGGQWLLAEAQLQALSELATSRQMLPSPLPSLSTGYVCYTPSSAEHSAQTTEPLCPLRAGKSTSLGSATEINLKPSGEGDLRDFETVKAVPVQGTLKQIFTLQASSLLRLVLPSVFWHMQLCCSPALASRMPEISTAEPQ